MTSVWGPRYWYVIHATAAAAPLVLDTEQRQRYLDFYNAIGHVLPCPGCREGYAELLATEDLKLSADSVATRESMFTWTVRMHNAVNRKLGKPEDHDVAAWLVHYSSFVEVGAGKPADEMGTVVVAAAALALLVAVVARAGGSSAHG